MEAPHSLGREEALRRLKDKFSLAKEAYQGQFKDLQEQWDDDSFTFGFKAAGMKVSGLVAVEESRVTLDARLPLAAMMFKGMIRQRVSDELNKLLA